MKKCDYREYLGSDHWRDTRLRALRRAGFQCGECGCKGVRLDVHHLTYERLWREWDTDLEVLCQSCHHRSHTSLAGWWDKVEAFLRGE